MKTFNLPPGGERFARPDVEEIKSALDRWLQLWQSVCPKYFGSGYENRRDVSTWVPILVASSTYRGSEHAGEVFSGMDINCGDALTKLKTLVQDDSDS